MKARKLLAVVPLLAFVVALLPFASQPAYADTVVDAISGSAVPAPASILTVGGTVANPEITVTTADVTVESYLNSDTGWFRKQDDGTWAKHSTALFVNGTYRFQASFHLPDSTYSFSDGTSLQVNGEYWQILDVDNARALPRAVFASPEITIPGIKLDTPSPLTRGGGTNAKVISWKKVDHVKAYRIDVKNITEGYGGYEASVEVPNTLDTYDLSNMLEKATVRSGSNTMVVSVTAVASAGYYDSEPASSPSAGWSFDVVKQLSLSVDAATGVATWGAYPFAETKYYYYWITKGTGEGTQLADGYVDASTTSLDFEAQAGKYGWETGNYFIHVVAMDGKSSDGGKQLTTNSQVMYTYTKKVKTVSFVGVTLPIEGGKAQAPLTDISVTEDNVSTPEPGYGSAYWRRYNGSTWVEVLPTDTFEVTGTYRISIPVSCDVDCVFADDLTVTVNGIAISAPVVDQLDTDRRSLRIDCVLDVAAKDDNVYVVKAGALNVRATPALDGERVGGLSYGDVVEPIATNGAWTMVDYDGQNAWVANAYLALTYSADTAFADGPVYYTVSAGAIRVRDDVSTSASSPTEMSNGKQVLATGVRENSEGTWIVIDYELAGERRLGYMRFSYVGPEGTTVYLFNGTTTPPVKEPAEEDTASDELVVDTGKYPKVSFAYKSAVAVGDTATLTDENFENKDDGYLATTIYPDDAKNFASLTPNKVKLGTVLAEMMVVDFSLNDDGSLYLKLGPKQEIAYEFTAGGNGTWTKGSTEGFSFTVNRNVLDSETFGLFTGIEVDGVAVDASNYVASAGSLDATLSASFLEGLSVGEHVLTVNFQDGSAETTLSIAEAADEGGDEGADDGSDEGDDDDKSDDKKSDKDSDSKSSNDKESRTILAKTGDNLPVIAIVAALVISLAVIVGFIVARRKRR